jgi:hypothetical protein
MPANEPGPGVAAGERPTTMLALLGGQVVPLMAPAEASLRQRKLFRAEDDWVVWQDGAFVLASSSQRLTRKVEQRYSELLGAGSHGWLFRDPTSGACLYIDRLLADPSPRLPCWTITVNDGQVGWDDAGWPASRKGGAWSLRESRWQVLKPEQFHTALPTTAPTTAITAAAESLSIQLPGQVAEEVILPSEAQGTLQPPLWVMAGEEQLYLHNQPGRVVHLGRESGRWIVRGVYQRNIPLAGGARRFWRDPAGRLCLAWENELAIFFPQGRITPEIRDMMPREQVQQLERDD